MTKKIKNPIIIGLIGALLYVSPLASADEREGIASLVKELDYLIEVTQSMQKNYGRSKGRVNFNYQALLQQLKTTRARTAEFLNSKGEVINREPPKTLDSELIRIK